MISKVQHHLIVFDFMLPPALTKVNFFYSFDRMNSYLTSSAQLLHIFDLKVLGFQVSHSHSLFSHHSNLLEQESPHLHDQQFFSYQAPFESPNQITRILFTLESSKGMPHLIKSYLVVVRYF